MFLQEPSPSPYDLRFQFMGFPIRVSWTFWAAAAVLGYDFANQLDFKFGPQSPGFLALLAIWAGCIFVSIAIHELGHAIAFRKFGIESSIVLYFMGGMAIPRAGASIRGELSPQQSMWVSIAGPLAQFMSAILLILALRLSSYSAPTPWPLNELTWLQQGNPIDSVGLFTIALMYIQPSVLWALLNLVPVWPLDGGRFIHSFLELRGGTILNTLWVSVVASGLLVLYSFGNGLQFLGFMFAILGWNNYQAIQQMQR